MLVSVASFTMLNFSLSLSLPLPLSLSVFLLHSLLLVVHNTHVSKEPGYPQCTRGLKYDFSIRDRANEEGSREVRTSTYILTLEYYDVFHSSRSTLDEISSVTIQSRRSTFIVYIVQGCASSCSIAKNITRKGIKERKRRKKKKKRLVD